MAITSAHFDQVKQLVAACSGIHLAPGMEGYVEARIEELAHVLKLKSSIEFFRQLEKNLIADVGFLLSEIVANKETSFFRDGHPFDALRQQVIPELMTQRAAEMKLTIWSAGCSTGQEPYSAALLLRQHFPALSGWAVEIHGADIAEDVLAVAQSGNYTQADINRGMPAPLLLKNFQKTGSNWQLKDEIRQLVQFRQVNLAEPWPELPKMDIIFLRYVLSYLTPEASQDILKKVAGLLRPDGYLFLGSKETVSGLDDLFSEEQINKAVCYRLKSAKPKWSVADDDW
jgi:chemotaxis protein methyltransferase CheR